VNVELNKALNVLENWSSKWLLNFNVSKTFYMSIVNSKVSTDSALILTLNNISITKVKSHKHLGLIFNDSLTWSDHIDSLCKKVSKKLGLLCKNRKILGRSILTKLYKSMVLPMIDYGSVIYDDMSKCLNNKMERIHRRAGIICSGANPRTETVKLLADLNWRPLKTRRDRFKLLYFYRIHVNSSPLYLNVDLRDLTNRACSETTRVTRFSLSGSLTMPYCRTSKFRKSFFPSTLSLWNDLKLNNTDIDSLSKFKKFLHYKFDLDERIVDYNLLVGSYSRILTQMRLGLSSLSGQLFKYNLTDNPFCSYCQGPICRGVGGLDPPASLFDPPASTARPTPGGDGLTPSLN